jgi:hypothetical protein
MPNYIYNKLILQGDWYSIKKIIGSDRKNPMKNKQTKPKSYKKFKFDLIAPLETNQISDQQLNTHYHQINAWGTKWQPWNVTLIKEPDQVILEFETAWDPPVNWINKLFELYPNIKFNLVWADEDFPRCGSIILNPIELNKPVIKNYEYNSESAVQFIKDNFKNLYLKCIKQYKSYYLLKIINEQLDKLINKDHEEKIRLECIEYDKNANPLKYKFLNIKNLDQQEKIIKESYEITKHICDEKNIKININNNFDVVIEFEL